MAQVSVGDTWLGSNRSPHSARKVLESAWHTLLLWQRRHSGRRALCERDERMLRDIGLTRVDVARACATPFWRSSETLRGSYGR